MLHHMHMHEYECDHDLCYCKKCDVVYCKKCGKEWKVSGWIWSTTTTSPTWIYYDMNNNSSHSHVVKREEK